MELEEGFLKKSSTSDGVMETWLKENGEEEDESGERVIKDAFGSHKKESSE